MHDVSNDYKRLTNYLVRMLAEYEYKYSLWL